MNSMRMGLWAMGLSGALLVGCAGVSPHPEDAMRQGAGAPGQDDAMTGRADTTTGFQGHPLDDPDSPLSNRVIYFAFDSSDIRPEDREILAVHARYLAQNPDIAVVLEGHADERGSREYNLALGERRAQAVERLMVLQGCGPNQLQVISFGEERPVAMGQDEASWALNRRVELLYSGY